MFGICCWIGTRDAVSACDGKVYKKGDKIMFGVPKVSGYLFVRTLTKDGKNIYDAKRESS